MIKPAGDAINQTWPFSGGTAQDIGVAGHSVARELHAAGPDEVVARVDAVCICSSDIKIIRMGSSHPLFSDRDLAQAPLVLGHEMSLTVHDVGENWRNTYRPGQRLGLQPAIIRDGKRTTIGIDLPGAFSQYVTLDSHVLGGHALGGPEPYVFDVPDGLSAAMIAMLEPYSCVEAAYRPNSRITLQPEGRLLIVGGPGSDAMTIELEIPVAEAVLVRSPAAVAAWAETQSRIVSVAEDLDALSGQVFDDIILCGAYDVAAVGAVLPLLADRGLLAIVSPDATGAMVAVDAARIHYREISFVGATGPDIEAAFSPRRNRFELCRDGIMLILGAGGAMGRIHLHRAIELADGPQTIIATSRKGARLERLRQDFEAMAARRDKRLVIIADADVEDAVRSIAPEGCNDVAVVAPNVEMVERGARLMRADGLLVVFAGMPFGEPCRLPLGYVASHGARFTGSTGSTVDDQLRVLARVEAGLLDLSGNLEAVAGFRALPAALAAVGAGDVSGKIAIYPFVPDLPLTQIGTLASADTTGGTRWSLADENRLTQTK